MDLRAQPLKKTLVRNVSDGQFDSQIIPSVHDLLATHAGHLQRV